MNWLALLGVLVVAYSLFALYVAFAKPQKIWDMKKVQTFKRVLGEVGTTIIFTVFGVMLLGLGIWIIIK